MYENLKHLDEYVTKSLKKKYSNSAGKKNDQVELERAITPVKLKSASKERERSRDHSKMSADFYVEYFRMLQ